MCQRGHDPQVENCWVPGWYTTSDHLVSIWLQFFTYIENLNCIGIIKVIWKPCLYQHEQLMYFWGRFKNEQEARKAKADYYLIPDCSIWIITANRKTKANGWRGQEDTNYRFLIQDNCHKKRVLNILMNNRYLILILILISNSNLKEFKFLFNYNERELH